MTETTFQRARREQTYSDVKICACCLFLLANGECGCPESGEDCGTADRLAAYETDGTDARKFYITLGQTTDECGHDLGDDAQGEAHTEECERHGFSWWPCDTCGSNLGGDRYSATVWPVEEGDR